MQEFSYRNRRGLLDQAAAAGRGGDTELAHLTPGEIVVPRSAQTPELRQQLLAALLGAGHDPERYVVGGRGDSRNPRTGLLEYSDQGVGEAASGGGAETGFGGGFDGYGGYDGGKDEGTRAAEAKEAAAPGQGPHSAGTYDTHGYGDLTLAGYRTGIPGLGWLGRQADWAMANPVAAGINALTSLTPLGLLNTGVGLVNKDWTVGGLTTSAARAATDYGKPSPVSFNAPQGPAVPNPTDPQSPPDGGDYGPSGSKDSPLSGGLLAQQQPADVAREALSRALIGSPGAPGAYNGWDGNQFKVGAFAKPQRSYGALQSSYSPTGTQYVTPWGAY